MRSSLSLILIMLISHNLVGCVVDPSAINERLLDMSTAGAEEAGGSEATGAGEAAGEPAGIEVDGGVNAGDSAGTSGGADTVGGVVAGGTPSEPAGEMAGELAGEPAGGRPDEPEQCPTAQVTQDQLSVTPESVITLDASPSIDLESPNERPVSYEWVVTNRPSGSRSTVVERFTDLSDPSLGGLSDDASTPEATFFVDLPGMYQFELTVRTQEMIDQGIDDCGANIKTVYLSTFSEPGFRVIMTWDTPGDPDQTDDIGADLDLHLRHPLSTRWATLMQRDEYSCYFANRAPDWGEEGPENNPSLDFDNQNGAGAEQLSYQDPEERDEPYRLGVYYYNNSGFPNSFGSSTASLSIYFSGELVFESSRELIDEDHFWEPALILWGSNKEVIEVDRYYETIPSYSPILDCINDEACSPDERCVDFMCEPAPCTDNDECEQSLCIDNLCVPCVESTDCSEGDICVSNQCFPQPVDTATCEEAYGCMVTCYENPPFGSGSEEFCERICDLSGESTEALMECLNREGCEVNSIECMEERCLAEAVQCNVHLTFE